jgi:hypothetical protein
VSLRQVNARLGLTTERYSPLLHCCKNSSGSNTSEQTILAIIPLKIKRDQNRRSPGSKRIRYALPVKTVSPWLSMQRCGLFGIFVPRSPLGDCPYRVGQRPSSECFPDCVTWQYQGHPQGKCAQNRIKKITKKLLTKNVCGFMLFLRGVFVAMFSGARRTGAKCFLGISIADLWMQVVWDSAAGWPPNHSVFSK